MNDIDLDGEKWNPKEISFIDITIAGSFAILIEHVSTFPIDTLKKHAVSVVYKEYNHYVLYNMIYS
jgi:hypothetical protein